VELTTHGSIFDHIFRTIGGEIDQTTSEGLLYQLKEGEYITFREAKLIQAAVSRDVLVFKLPFRDEFRASLLKAMLTTLLCK
jgi:transcriptional regulator CtsR